MLRLRYRFAAATVLLAAALSSSACAGPSPAPATPSGSPTPASDEEAFRAAEATYRAYVDALNAARRGDTPDLSPHSFLSGGALVSAKQTAEELAAAGLQLRGISTVLTYRPINRADGLVTFDVCIDLRDTRLFDDTHNDVTPRERPEQQSLRVVFDEDDQTIVDSSAGQSTC